MKKITISLFLLAFSFTAISQSAVTETPKRTEMSLRKATVAEVNDVKEVLSALYSLSSDYVEHWSSVTDILSTSVEASSGEQILFAENKQGRFSESQKNILQKSDVGSEILLTVAYREKELFTNEFSSVKYMNFDITVMPDHEAQFPGGMPKVVDYLRGNVIQHMPDGDSASLNEKMKMAEVKFTIDENGKVSNARISRSSNDEHIDKLLLEATLRMPVWNPARNIKGEKIKREFTLSVDKMNTKGC